MSVISDRVGITFGAITLIGSLVGGVLLVDDRYALARDFAEYKMTTQSQLIQYQNSNRLDVLETRKSALEDKLFELDTRRGTKNFTTGDEALYKRYAEQINSINIKEQKVQLQLQELK